MLLLCTATVVTACSDGSDAAATDGAATITVSAASSLRGVFTELGERLESAEGVQVQLNLDSSSSLATQIVEGAPADVYASAAPEDMERLVDADLVASPEAFARNRLAIVTRPGNPEGIGSLGDLVDAGTVSLCGEDVPCGRYAQRALDRAGVSIPESQITRGQNVAATLTAVTEGDAVAGVVYVSDATAAGDAVESVPIPAADDLVATYVIDVVAGTARAELAQAFVELVLSDAGQAVLQEHGFLPPA